MRGLLSFLDHNDFHTPVTGLDAFAPEDRPPVEASFLFFHGMVAIGFSLIAISALGFLYFRHGSLHERRWLLWILVFSVPVSYTHLMGMHIMKYRAGVLDASLEVRSGSGGTGTTVVCTFRKNL